MNSHRWIRLASLLYTGVSPAPTYTPAAVVLGWFKLWFDSTTGKLCWASNAPELDGSSKLFSLGRPLPAAVVVVALFVAPADTLTDAIGISSNAVVGGITPSGSVGENTCGKYLPWTHTAYKPGPAQLQSVACRVLSHCYLLQELPGSNPLVATWLRWPIVMGSKGLVLFCPKLAFLMISFLSMR